MNQDPARRQVVWRRRSTALEQAACGTEATLLVQGTAESTFCFCLTESQRLRRLATFLVVFGHWLFTHLRVLSSKAYIFFALRRR